MLSSSELTVGPVLRQLQRRFPTPVAASDSASGQSLPGDLLLQICRRVAIVSLAFGSLWTFMTFVNVFVLASIRVTTYEISHAGWRLPLPARAGRGNGRTSGGRSIIRNLSRRRRSSLPSACNQATGRRPLFNP